MKRNSKKPNDTAKTIGVGLAHVQAFFDDVCKIAFKGLKNLSKDEGAKSLPKDDNSQKIVSGLRKVAGFMGEAGDSYYKKYEDIKAKRAKKQNRD